MPRSEPTAVAYLISYTITNLQQPLFGYVLTPRHPLDWLADQDRDFSIIWFGVVTGTEEDFKRWHTAAGQTGNVEIPTFPPKEIS